MAISDKLKMSNTAQITLSQTVINKISPPLKLRNIFIMFTKLKISIFKKGCGGRREKKKEGNRRKENIAYMTTFP